MRLWPKVTRERIVKVRLQSWLPEYILKPLGGHQPFHLHHLLAMNLTFISSKVHPRPPFLSSGAWPPPPSGLDTAPISTARHAVSNHQLKQPLRESTGPISFILTTTQRRALPSRRGGGREA